MNEISSLLHLIFLVRGFSKSPVYWPIQKGEKWGGKGIAKLVHLYDLFCATSFKLA
jgi:hypothetical protein